MKTTSNTGWISKTALFVGAGVAVIVVGVLASHSVASSSIPRLLRESDSARMNGDVQEEERLLSCVVEEDPGNTAAFQRLAVLSRGAGRYASSAVLWHRVGRLDPLALGARKEEALNLMAAGFVEDVISLLEPVERDVDETVMLARAYLMSGRIEDANRLVTTESEEAVRGLGLQLIAADLLFVDQRFDEAERLYLKLRDAGSLAASAEVGLGNCAMALRQDEEEALDYYRSAAERTGHRFQAGRILAEHLEVMGRVDEAVAEWTRMLGRYPSAVEVIVPLAELYAQQNDAAAIQRVREKIPPSGMKQISYRYYLSGLAFCLEREYEKAVEYLDWSREVAGERPRFAVMEFQSIVAARKSERLGRAVRQLCARQVTPESLIRLADLLLFEGVQANRNGDDEFASALGRESSRIRSTADIVWERGP
jgi:tetratricopeptide (TPR) repeat protein